MNAATSMPFVTLAGKGYVGCELGVFPGQPRQHLRFSGGVTAIYGRNGVGKSRTLSRLSSVLRRSGAGGSLYYRCLATEDSKVSVPFHDESGVSVAFDYLDDVDDRGLEVRRDEIIVEVAGWFCGNRDTTGMPNDSAALPGGGWTGIPVEPSLALEIASHKLFVLSPGPTGWWVRAAIPQHPEPGPLRVELDRVRALVNGDLAPPDGLTEWGEMYGEYWDGFPLCHVWDAVLADSIDAASPPQWVPLALETVGETASWVVTTVVELDPEDGSDPPVSTSLSMSSTAEEVSGQLSLVNEVFSTLYLYAFDLAIDRGEPDRWFAGEPPRWFAAGSGGVALADLSDTQRRWASAAIRLADAITAGHKLLSEYDYRESLTFVADEPERGMDLLAQRHLSRGMNDLHRRFGIEFFVATHSPAIIDDPQTHLVSAHRDERSHLQLTEIDTAEATAFERLGIPAWELPQLYRTYLLVEGAHDKAVIDETIGGELALLRVKILPVRGASSQLTAIAADADFLIQHTTASFVVLLDNTTPEPFQHALEFAQGGATSADIDRYLEGALGQNRTDEEKILFALLSNATQSGSANRIRGIEGLPVRDVIELLPSSIVTEDYTWAQLRDLHTRQRQQKKNTAKDFKRWLELRFGADLSTTALRMAAAELDEIPACLTTLLETCRNATEFGAAGDRHGLR
jgi:predicted ATPase